MLNALDRRVSLRLLMTLFPVAFLIHDSEEIFFTAGWTARNLDRLTALVEKLPLSKSLLAGAEMTTAQWAVAVGALLVVVCLVTWLGVRALPKTSVSPAVGGAAAGSAQVTPARVQTVGLDAYIGMVAILGLNALTHLGQSVIIGGYTPGVVTAILVSLPYSFYTLRRLKQAGLIVRRRFILTLLTGAVIMLPLVLLVHAIGRWLA